MKTFNELDSSLIDFWKMHGISEKDLHCRKCGSALVNFDELENIEVIHGLDGFLFRDKDAYSKWYVESPQNRWCVKGRTLSGKTYFRHLCWDCLKKEIPYAIEHNDKLQLISPSRLKKWTRMLANGKIQKYIDKLPPPAWNSPIWWFRLIFDITEDELNAERTKFDTASINSFIRRYGEDEGKRKYEEYVKLQAKAGCTLEYFVEKLGQDVGTKRYEELCKNKGVSKKNCIEKYGKEVGEKFFNQYCSKQSYAGVSLQWYIDKYGKEVGE